VFWSREFQEHDFALVRGQRLAHVENLPQCCRQNSAFHQFVQSEYVDAVEPFGRIRFGVLAFFFVVLENFNCQFNMTGFRPAPGRLLRRLHSSASWISLNI